MDIKLQIKKLLARTCVVFTVIMLVYASIVAILNTEADEILISGVRIMFFFIFSLLFSFAGTIYSAKAISAPVRLLLHYIITLFATCLCLFLPAELAPSAVIVGIVLFTVLYFIIAGLSALILSALKRRREKKEVYENKFSR